MNNTLWLNQYCKELTIVAGLPRSGKSLLAPLVSSMDQAEVFHMDFLIEVFPALKDLNMISSEGLEYLLQYSIHTLSYNRATGRNMNIKPSDETSIWHSKTPQKYFERVFLDESVDIAKDTHKFPLILVLHNALTYINSLNKAFEEVKVVNICSHPIDVVDAWMKKQYGQDMYGKKGVALPVLKWKDQIIPLYAKDWEDEYLASNETDRVISMLYQLHIRENFSLSKVNEEDNGKLLMVNYDELVMNPKAELEKVSAYLEKPITLFTNKVIQKMALNERKKSISYRESKLMAIRKNASNACLEKLDVWISSYKEINY